MTRFDLLVLVVLVVVIAATMTLTAELGALLAAPV